MQRAACRCAVALLLVLAPVLLHAHEFVLYSQNMLRFGHGRRIEEQCKAIDEAAKQVDIIILQEVMRADYPCLSSQNNYYKGSKPANFEYATSGALGATSYKEYYGFLYRTAGTRTGSNKAISIKTSSPLQYAGSFSRPPYAIRFEIDENNTKKPCSVWIADFHAIFGKHVSLRQGEAQEMAKVWAGLASQKPAAPIIVGGDWNIPTTDSAFTSWVSGVSAVIEPNEQSSITNKGVYSSAYDHFLHSSSLTFAAANNGKWLYTGTGSLLDWRTKVSDHAGLFATVTLTC